jgi:hypothetical protein
VSDGLAHSPADAFASDILTNVGGIGVGVCGAVKDAAPEIGIVAMGLIYFGDITAFGFGLAEAVKPD